MPVRFGMISSVVAMACGLGAAQPQLDRWRADLWLEGSRAVAAAAALEHVHVDARESRRVVELLLPEAFRPGTPARYATRFRFVLGCADLPNLFASLPENRPWAAATSLKKIHVYARADHLPVICRALRSSDSRIRAAAAEAFNAAVACTDRHRATIASTLGALAGDRFPERPRGGFPARLRQSLRLLYVEEHEELGELYAEAWVQRWLAEEVPSADDAGLLIDLVRVAREHDLPGLHLQALRGLGRIPELAEKPRWPELANPDDVEAQLFVLAARAARGSAAARRELRDHATRSPLAFALLLDGDADAARQIARAMLADESRGTLLEEIATELSEQRALYGLNWDPGVFAPLGDAARQAGARSLALALLRLPGLRQRSVADALATAFASAAKTGTLPAGFGPGPAALDETDQEDTLGHLEVLFPKRLRDALRSWSGSEDAIVRTFGCRFLARLGDPESAARLVAWMEGRDEDAHEDFHRLARTRSPVVVRFLRDAGRPRALAQALGVPEPCAAGLEVPPKNDASPRARQFRRRLATGDGVGAVAALVTPPPDEKIANIGLVGHPAVTRYLRRLQSRRDLGLYWWATGQLMLQGDRAARAEVRDVVHAGRYMTMEALGDTRVLSLGHDPATIAYWIEELETNCCRISTYGGNVVGELLGFDGIARARGLETPKARVDRAWDPRRDTLRWSQILDRFVVVRGS